MKLQQCHSQMLQLLVVSLFFSAFELHEVNTLLIALLYKFDFSFISIVVFVVVAYANYCNTLCSAICNSQFTCCANNKNCNKHCWNNAVATIGSNNSHGTKACYRHNRTRRSRQLQVRPCNGASCSSTLSAAGDIWEMLLLFFSSFFFALPTATHAYWARYERLNVHWQLQSGKRLRE